MGIKHGLHGTPEYIAWKNMRGRCRNPNRREWSSYGGRGIKVHRAFNDFATFYAELGPKPPNTSLDRIDNNGDYAPGNLRWATKKEQMRNRSDNRMLTHDGQTKTLAEWSETTGISLGTLWMRLHVLKWPDSRILTEPLWDITKRAIAGAEARWHR